LEDNIRLNIRERGEFQLTSCLDAIRRHDGFVGICVRGRRYDIGLPLAYVESLAAFSRTPLVRAVAPCAGA
jgi:UTP--glucose-1-phosphate uridylyltransferase